MHRLRGSGETASLWSHRLTTSLRQKLRLDKARHVPSAPASGTARLPSLRPLSPYAAESRCQPEAFPQLQWPSSVALHCVGHTDGSLFRRTSASMRQVSPIARTARGDTHRIVRLGCTPLREVLRNLPPLLYALSDRRYRARWHPHRYARSKSLLPMSPLMFLPHKHCSAGELSMSLTPFQLHY